MRGSKPILWATSWYLLGKVEAQIPTGSPTFDETSIASDNFRQELFFVDVELPPFFNQTSVGLLESIYESYTVQLVPNQDSVDAVSTECVVRDQTLFVVEDDLVALSIDFSCTYMSLQVDVASFPRSFVREVNANLNLFLSLLDGVGILAPTISDAGEVIVRTILSPAPTSSISPSAVGPTAQPVTLPPTASPTFGAEIVEEEFFRQEFIVGGSGDIFSEATAIKLVRFYEGFTETFNPKTDLFDTIVTQCLLEDQAIGVDTQTNQTVNSFDFSCKYVSKFVNVTGFPELFLAEVNGNSLTILKQYLNLVIKEVDEAKPVRFLSSFSSPPSPSPTLAPISTTESGLSIWETVAVAVSIGLFFLACSVLFSWQKRRQNDSEPRETESANEPSAELPTADEVSTSLLVGDVVAVVDGSREVPVGGGPEAERLEFKDQVGELTARPSKKEAKHKRPAKERGTFALEFKDQVRYIDEERVNQLEDDDDRQTRTRSRMPTARRKDRAQHDSTKDDKDPDNADNGI